MRDFKPILLAVSLLTSTQVFAEEGWVDLFNGKDLTGWTQRTGNAKYFVEDGCIVGQMVVPGGGTNSFLCTTKEYDNFILELDFKVDPALNSGVQIRSHYSDEPLSMEVEGTTYKLAAGYVYGYQVEIDTDLKGKCFTGGVYDERRRRGYIYPPGAQNGPVAQAFTKENRTLVKPADWNHLRIEAIGDSFRTYVNGVRRSTFKDSITPKGFFGLQVHNSADKSHDGVQARFKNVRLKTVAASEAHAEAPVNALTEQEKKDGWQLLWDGNSTAGWHSAKAEEFPKEGWMIKDGELMVTNTSGDESAGGGDIITKDRYSDFELVAEFKSSPGCNSGIKYFVQPNLAPITGSGAKATVGSAIGLEFQILDDERHPDAKLGRDGDRTIGSLYDLKPASADKKVNFIGDWNTARIVSHGKHVEHWLNGAKVLEYERGSPEFRKLVAQSKYSQIPNFGEWADGHILLQEHGSMVSFRNVRIRLPAAR